MKEIEAKGNISDIISSLKNESLLETNKDIWFRGQPDYEDNLIPSLFRHKQKDGTTLFYNEAGIYEEFIRRYPEHSNSHKNVFEWLTLMQHYGLPTRLLDWTTNLLVALYFCCHDDKYKDNDGAVFAFNPSSTLSNNNEFRVFLEILVTSDYISLFYKRLIDSASNIFGEKIKINGIWLNDWKSDFLHLNNVVNDLQGNGVSQFKSFEEYHDITSENIQAYSDLIGNFSRVYRFKSPHLNPRIRRQHGCFTFHGGKYFQDREFIKSYDMERSESSLIKIKIRSTDKNRLLKELALSGITEATLFPEMEYQAKQIKEIYTNKP